MNRNTKERFLVGVVGIIVKNNTVLTLKRAAGLRAQPGLWECVSGKLEPGEQPFAAVQREIREECRLEVAVDERPLGALQHVGEQNKVIIFYRARYLSGNVCLSPEHSDYAWLSGEVFEQRCPFKGTVRHVHEALKGSG